MEYKIVPLTGATDEDDERKLMEASAAQFLIVGVIPAYVDAQGYTVGPRAIMAREANRSDHAQTP